ncbi:MAG: hypothetical protein M1470_13825 [Bacteroidetes bacterium]|nr:hypothetical protein [Bacteroidota bacterium]
MFNIVLLTASIELFLEVGYFIKIGNVAISYRRVSEAVMFFVSLYTLSKYPIRKNKTLKYAIGLSSISLLAVLLLFIFPSNVLVGTITNSWSEIIRQQAWMSHPEISIFVLQEYIQMLIYVTTMLAIYSSFREEDYFRLIDLFTRVIKFSFVLGVLEFMIKYGFHYLNYGKFLDLVFGYRSSTTIVARIRGFGVELQGLTQEASHYSYVLFVSIVILLSRTAISKSQNDYRWIFLGIVLMVFCMAFSSVLFISAFVCIYMLYSWNSTRHNYASIRKGFLVTVLILAALILILSFNPSSLPTSPRDFFSRRIASLFQEERVISSGYWQVDRTALEWSNRVRLVSILITLEAFLLRPLFGYGLGTITCFGATAMMLAGTGIFGLYYWTKFNFAVKSKVTANLNRKYFGYGVLIFLLVNIFNALGLRPFFELHSFLFAISTSLLFDRR